MIDLDKPIIIAICGKSAVGKDSVARRLHDVLLNHDCENHIVVSTTTRPIRPKEQDGVDYNFVTREEFLKTTNNFLEYTEFNNWYYGISKDQIQDGVNIVVIDPQGLHTLEWNSNKYTVIPVLLKAPFFTRLRRSIKREGKFRWEHIRRMFADNRDFRDFEAYFNLLPNALVYKSFHGLFNQDDDRIYILNALVSKLEEWQIVYPVKKEQV